MSEYEPDKYDKQTWLLLPCEWLTDHGATEDCESMGKDDPCHTCACREQVATALRERDSEIERLKAQLAEHESGADRQRLLAERYSARSACDILHTEISQLKAQLADAHFEIAGLIKAKLEGE